MRPLILTAVLYLAALIMLFTRVIDEFRNNTKRKWIFLTIWLVGMILYISIIILVILYKLNKL